MKAKLQQLKNEFHLKLSNQQLAAVGGVLCVGALAYAAYKYMAPNKNGKTPHPQAEQQKSFQQTYRQVIMNVQQCINRYQALNGQVIKCILKNQYKLAQYEYKAFMFKVRNQRRKVMKDKHEYRRVILSIDAANEELMDKNLNAILAHFNIEKTNWIETVELWSSDTEQNKQEWQNLLIDLDNQLLDSLRDKSKAPLTCRKLQDIFKFKIYSLNHLNESGLDLDSSVTSDDEPDLNAKYTLIDKYIQDLVFNKFNVEEEDIVYSENQLSKDDQDKIYTIEDQFTELIRVAIYGDENSDEEVLGDDESGEGKNQGEDQYSQQGSAPAKRIDDRENQQQPQSKWQDMQQKQPNNQGEQQDEQGQYF